MKKTVIIAEAGVNHNGSIDLARKLVDAALDAGADMVKFQTFKASSLVSKTAPKAEYQTKAAGARESQFEMIQKLELSAEAHRELLDHCKERGIQFLSTPFDLESADYLIHELDLRLIKVSSPDLLSAPLLMKLAQADRKIILSTGMSTLQDVEAALGVLAFGYLKSDRKPNLAAFHEAFHNSEARYLLRDRVSILQCTTEYPAPMADINLRVLETLRQAFGLPVGLSDHSEGIAIPIAAAGLGAEIIEKHFTLDRSLPGPDHQASLEPKELKQMILSIRQVEQALGDGKKTVRSSESKNLYPTRRSLVAARSILQGEVFTESNLTFKRPGNGISPMRYWEYLGKTAERDYQIDEGIDP